MTHIPAKLHQFQIKFFTFCTDRQTHAHMDGKNKNAKNNTLLCHFDGTQGN